MSQYSRSQAIKLLNVTGHQLDYMIKQINIQPTKIGHASVFSFEQLVKINLAFSLKNDTTPYKVIEKLLEFIEETDYLVNSSEDIVIIFKKSDKNIEVFESDEKFFDEIHKKVFNLIFKSQNVNIKSIENYDEQVILSDKTIVLDEKTIVHIIRKSYLGFVIEEFSKNLDSEIDIKIKSINPLLPKIYENLKKSSVEHHIPIPDVA